MHASTEAFFQPLERGPPRVLRLISRLVVAVFELQVMITVIIIIVIVLGERAQRIYAPSCTADISSGNANHIANYRPAEKRQKVRRSTGFDNPGHLASAFGALAHQQQRTTLDHTGEVLDDDRVPAADTPNIGQQ